MTMKISTQTALRTTTLVGLALWAMALPGCRGDRSDKPPRQFFPDLDDQMKWKPQTNSDFFADSRTMRKPVQGTVGFGRVSFVNEEPWAEHWMQERADFIKEDPAFYEGKGADGTYLTRIPVEVTAKLIERGKLKYNIYCVVCHGYSGDGKGMVGGQWSYALPNFHDAKYKTPDPNDAKAEFWKDGYLFKTGRLGVLDPSGVQKMPGYAHALSEGDVWAVVAYIRTLQESHTGTLQDVPEQERQILERTRAAAQAAQQAAAPVAPATIAPAGATPPSNPSATPAGEHGKDAGAAPATPPTNPKSGSVEPEPASSGGTR